MPRRAIAWIRRDLRLGDHAALAAATAEAEATAVLFVFDRNILSVLEDRDDRRLTFIRRSLVEIETRLRERGSRLLVRHGDPLEEVPAAARALGAETVVAARDYEPYAVARDTEVRKRLEAQGARLGLVRDSVLREPHEVVTPEGRPYSVYTPYAKTWRRTFAPARDAARFDPDLGRLAPAEEIAPHVHPWEYDDLGFVENDLWLDAGEAAANARLDAFAAAKLNGYGEGRNFPARDGTSALSVHLRFGTVSPRECVRRALAAGPDGDKWLSELIWRDFYQHVLWHRPDVVEMPFQAQYGGLVYPGDDAHFEAWTRGETGYPLVDAAMRGLAATGWMHNRLRMVVASFLTKDLLVDYRKGEAWFARKLLDFDLASNNGGWQWAASTGADPQPYFRIFNPTLQSERYDPDAAFIRRWVPELARLTDRSIHAPWRASEIELRGAGVEIGRTYPAPIVDHAVQAARAKELLKGARG